jgi:hypothetical protein
MSSGDGRPSAGSAANAVLRRKGWGPRPSVLASASGSRLADAVAWRTSYNGGCVQVRGPSVPLTAIAIRLGSVHSCILLPVRKSDRKAFRCLT